MAGQTICRFHILILNLTIGIFHTGTPQRRFHILWINIGGAAIILSPPENLQRVYRPLQQLAKIFGRRRCCFKCAILLDADDGRRCPADLVTLFMVMEYDEIYHLGLATFLQQVIRGTEGINLTSCDDFEGVSYLLYHPSCPWNRSDTDRRPIGCRSLASFLVRRKAPKHRKHIRQLLEQYGCDGFEGFLQVTYALSLNDTFWIRRAGSSLNWRQISLYTNPFNEIITQAAFDGQRPPDG